MESIDSSPASPNPRKRPAPEEDTPGKKPLNLKGTQFIMPTPPDTEESSNASPVNEKPKDGSPAPSISTMTSIDVVDSRVAGPSTTATQAEGSKPPPPKRRKLTAAEKGIEAKMKAEKKAAKEEEKQIKDEEKRRKAEEKEVKRREKDLDERRKAEEKEVKRREKNLEEQRKEEAKLKKERGQLRLASFFGTKPVTPAKLSTADSTSGLARRKSLSLEPFDVVADQIRRSASPVKREALQPTAHVEQAATPAPLPIKEKASVSDYDKYFLPYQLPTHSTRAATYDIPCTDDRAYWQGEFDRDIKDPTFREKVDLGLVDATALVDHLFERDVKRGWPLLSMRALMDSLQGTSRQPINLTLERSQHPKDVLKTVTRRHLHFSEDVRPAYFGTYSKALSPHSARRVMVQPYAARVRTDTDYDYDSEAEWEEPEEGEDIGDEEDEVESLGDADEMDGFLDDEEDTSKRKLITGDLQPSCTGLCWENTTNMIVQSIEDEDGHVTMTEGTSTGLKGMRLGILLPNMKVCSIDPFSTAYWAHEMAPPGVPLSDVAPTRPPLQERNLNGSPLTQTALAGAASTTLSGPPPSASKRGPKGQVKTLNTEDFEEFKTAVVGSTTSKIEIQKSLKTRFPKVTNEAIRENLSKYFAYMGAKGDKKWRFVVVEESAGQ
ncbi:hypothetical protein LTR62_008498 [Meristemomyces frigidus]|uniref:Chromatin assembly factor 1 subunit A n=1 Tax=Meristemomyces frigidus TaxID=1508187 RepID=A0AAN7THX1_9PEZI|nr:hypothetical protein LTR62_008498 [Meristemomyces frigidus]